MIRQGIVAAGLTSLALPVVATGAVINVPADHLTIQQAIDAASFTEPDEIIVAAGVYNEAINLQGKPINLRSAEGPSETVINAVNMMNSAITTEFGEGPDTIIDGFTITGGIGRLVASKRWGGGMVNLTTDPTVKNCVFFLNFADEGGAVHNYDSGPVMSNCVFISNIASGFPASGGAIYNQENSNPVLLNCTLVGNVASGTGAGVHSDESSTRFVNSILRDDSLNEFGGTLPIVTYSNVMGGYAGEGNIDADPMFVDSGTGDLRLLAGSPCIDRGDSTAVSTIIFADLDGLMRAVDDPDSPDLGIATFGLVVDMGVHEFQVDPPPSSCPGDVSGGTGEPDGMIGFQDLLLILSNWGPCP